MFLPSIKIIETEKMKFYFEKQSNRSFFFNLPIGTHCVPNQTINPLSICDALRTKLNNHAKITNGQTGTYK